MNSSYKGQVSSPANQPNQFEYVGNAPDRTTPATYHAWIDVAPITPKKRTDSHIREQKKNDINIAKEKAKDNLRHRLSQIGHDFKSASKNEKLWKQVKAEYKKLKEQYIKEIHEIRQNNRNNASNAIKDAISNPSFPLSNKNVPKIDQPSKTKRILPNGIIVKPGSGANIKNLSPKIFAVMPDIVKAFNKVKPGFKPGISSGNDGHEYRKNKNTLHFKDKAIDLSRWNMDKAGDELSAEDVKKIAKAITGNPLLSRPVAGDPGRMVSVWNTKVDGKAVKFEVIVEYPGKSNQHIHIELEE